MAKTTPKARTMKSWIEEFRSVQFLAGKNWLINTLGLNTEQVEALLSLPASEFLVGDISMQSYRLHRSKFPLQEGQDLVDITLKLVARLIERGVSPAVSPSPTAPPAQPTPSQAPNYRQLARLDWEQLRLMAIAITGGRELPRGIDKDHVGIWLYHKAHKEFGDRAEQILTDAYRMLGHS